MSDPKYENAVEVLEQARASAELRLEAANRELVRLDGASKEQRNVVDEVRGRIERLKAGIAKLQEPGKPEGSTAWRDWATRKPEPVTGTTSDVKGGTPVNDASDRM